MVRRRKEGKWCGSGIGIAILLVSFIIFSSITALAEIPTLATESISATRDISKQTVVPGETFTVTVEVIANEDVYAPLLDEDVPEEWTVTPVQNDKAIFKPGEIKWLWLEMLSAGSTKTVIYNVTVPENASEGDYFITGNISAYQVSPVTVKGESKVIVGKKPDLIISNVLINPECTHEMFANESNTINATICNIGGADAGAFAVRFSIAGTSFAANVSGLNAGECVNVSATTLSISAGDYNLTVEADINDAINETNEENNTWSQTVTVYNNGYKGKRYTGGEDIETARNYTVKGDVVYSVGDSYYLSGYNNPWTSYTVNWTRDNLSIPNAAEIEKALLYVYYCSDKSPDGDPTDAGDGYYVNLTFNGISKMPVRHFTDRKGFGGYDFPSGMIVYNVTSELDAVGTNKAVLTYTWPSGAYKDLSIEGMVLLVVYKHTNEPERMIWINEGCDILYANNNYCVNSTEATAFATFAGTIDIDNVTEAKLITVVPFGNEGDDKNRLYFNGHLWKGIWNKYPPCPPGKPKPPELGINETDVTDALCPTNNTAAFQSNIPEGDTEGDYMVATNAILVVTKPILPPEPFIINGYVFYANGSACNGPIVNITNLNRTETWRAETSPDSNYYELSITTANVSTGEVLRFEAKSPDGIFNITKDHTVTEDDVTEGGIFNFNLTLSGPPIFNYSNLNVSPIEGKAPLNITACARVENIGGSAGEYNATLKINDEVVRFKKGWLGVGENMTVCFNYTLTEAGTYNVTIDELPAVEVTVRAANIKYSDLNVTPTSGTAPLTITASARVENVGDAAGDYNATLKVDGNVVNYTTGTLNPGENTTVCFIYIFTEAGTYNVTIDELPAKTVVVTKEIHDVYIDTEYTGTYGTGIRIDNATVEKIPLDWNLTIGKTYHIKFKVVNNGTVKPERANITVEISNKTWRKVLDTYEKDITNHHWGNVTWNTSGLAPGNYIITVNASIPDDAHPEDNERTRGVVLVEWNILCYYCCLEGDCCYVSTTELLKAADDWSKNIAPPGFDEPLTTTQLLQLADWWSKNATTPCC